MLIKISVEELNKFPKNIYDNTDFLHPVLTEEASYKFKLLAQNMINYMCCGEVLGDVISFTQSGIVYEEVVDIPSGYQQRILPPQYGLFLNKQQIETGLLLENQELVSIGNLQEKIVDILINVVGVVL